MARIRPFRRKLARATLTLFATATTIAATGVASATELASGAYDVRADQPAPSPPSRGAVLQPGWSVGTFVGYGVSVGAELLGGAHENRAFGLGAGLRGRYTAPFGLLAGARLSHHFGEEDGAAPFTTGLVELGWALPVGKLRAEVFGAAGVTRITSSAELCNGLTGQCATQDSSSDSATFGVGTTLAYPLLDRFFVHATAETMVIVAPVFGVSGYVGAGATF